MAALLSGKFSSVMSFWNLEHIYCNDSSFMCSEDGCRWAYILLVIQFTCIGSVATLRTPNVFLLKCLRNYGWMEWNSITAGYALCGFINEALNIYHEMQDSGVKMDAHGPGTVLVVSIIFLSPPRAWASVGYFLCDLGMIFWFYPSLGGMEYVVHHLLSLVTVAYALLTGEGQFYTYMVLISEMTTPWINLRWYLDTAGMKTSRAYLINGMLMFIFWMVARILLFLYLLHHVYLHYDQVKLMHAFGHFLVITVPSILSVMNLIWFGKIVRGLKKTLAKRD